MFLLLNFFRNFTHQQTNTISTHMPTRIYNILNSKQLPPPVKGIDVLGNNHLQAFPLALLHLALSSCGRVCCYLLFSSLFSPAKTMTCILWKSANITPSRAIWTL